MDCHTSLLLYLPDILGITKFLWQAKLSCIVEKEEERRESRSSKWFQELEVGLLLAMSLPFRGNPWPFTSPHPQHLGPTFEGESYLDYRKRFMLAVAENPNSDSDSDSDSDFDSESSSIGSVSDEDQDDAEPELDEDPANDVRRFMTGLEDEATRLEHRDQVEVVASFTEVDSEASETEATVRLRYLAIVDTRGVGCWASCSRPHRGALTKVKFEEELRCPVRNKLKLPCCTDCLRQKLMGCFKIATSDCSELCNTREQRWKWCKLRQLPLSGEETCVGGQTQRGVPTCAPDVPDRDMFFWFLPLTIYTHLRYLSDLDARGIRVLFRTAPRSQRQALMALSYQHLRPNPRLSVTVTVSFKIILCFPHRLLTITTWQSKGAEAYMLHFSLPLYSLRNESNLRTDTRRWPNGEALRQSKVLTCLSVLPTPTAGEKWCLYEGQTSIVLTGRHDHHWTVYGVFDDYYDAKSTDSVKQHHRLWKKTPEIFWDPIFRGENPLINTAGSDEAGNPNSSIFWDARQYFIAAVEIQVQMIVVEWRDIVSKLEKAVYRRCPTLPKPHETDHGRRTEEFAKWSADMLDIVGDFIVCLTKTTRVFDQFEQGDMSYFTSGMYIGHATKILKSRDDLAMRLAWLELLKTKLTEAKGPAVSAPSYGQLEVQPVTLS